MHDRGVGGAGATLSRSLCARVFAARGLATLAALGLDAGGPASAARPFVTDDADVITPASCEVELVQAAQLAHDAEREGSSSAQVSCGVGARTELSLAGLRFTRGSEHWPAIAIGGKTGLRPVAEGDIGVAVAYSLLGEKQPGSELRETRGLATLVATGSLGHILAHGNFGYTYDRIVHAGTAVWAFAMEHLGERFDFGGELYAEGTRSPWLGAGARYAVLRDRLSVDASYVVRMNSSHAKRATVGMTIAF
jgi:hypothetical protein